MWFSPRTLKLDSVPERSQARSGRRVPGRRAVARCRPRLEALEDRLVLSTINVTTTADGVAGSLRAAIIQANASNGHDTIIVPAGTYTLTMAGANEDSAATGDLDIRSDLTISGAGSDRTIIDGGGLDRVLQVFGAKAAISGVTIQGGNASQGAGLFNSGGNVTLSQCVIDGVAQGLPGGTAEGGALFNAAGTLNIAGGLISGSAFGGDGSSGGSALGGSLYLETGSTLVVSNATIIGHAVGGTADASGTGGSGEGGGIYAAIGASVAVTNSTISRSFATGNGGFGVSGGVGAGGAIYDAGADLTIDRCVFADNQARGGTAYVGLAGNGMGGAIFVAGGNASVANSFLEGNYAIGGSGPAGGDSLGGGIDLAAGNLALTNSTLEDNIVEFDDAVQGNDEGGGIYQAAGTLTVSHCSLSANEALCLGGGGVALGGGIFVGGGTLTLTNSTISGNLAEGATGIGGGLYIAAGYVCMDRPTFLAITGNSASTSNPDIFGPFTIC